jgi:hypothetical protein
VEGRIGPGAVDNRGQVLRSRIAASSAWRRRADVE